MRGDCWPGQRLIGGHPVEHVGHGDGVRDPLGLVKDGAGQAGIGCRLGQEIALLRAVVVIAAHGVILRHWCMVRKGGLFKSLGHVFRQEKLFHVLIIARKVVANG